MNIAHAVSAAKSAVANSYRRDLVLLLSANVVIAPET
jgi:hypothetical protein